MADMRGGAAGVVGVGAHATIDVGSTVPMVERQLWRAWTSIRSKVNALHRLGIMHARRSLISLRAEVAAVSVVEWRQVI